MMEISRMEELINTSGYKKKYIAAKCDMKPQWLADVVAKRRKIKVDEYIKFCNFFHVNMDGSPIKG